MESRDGTSMTARINLRAGTPRPGRKILFLTRSLGRGGAERQLVELARGLHERGREVVVSVFYPGGPLEADLDAAGIPVRSLAKRGRWDTVGFFFRLLGLIRAERPVVLHSYLDVPNVLAAMLAPIIPHTRIVWGIRSSNMDLDLYDALARASSAAERVLARMPHAIILNSRAGMAFRVRRAFPAARMHVIPNGIDSQRYRPDRALGLHLRAAWTEKTGYLLIGNVARFHPMKDHPTFLRAAALVAEQRDDIRFICVGDGPVACKRDLQRLASELGLEGSVIWAGAQDDMGAVYNALDVACSSSSSGEGFSNAVGEAMACGIPCVVTDVGDSSWIVDHPLSVVPSGDPQSLAAALLRHCDLSPEERDEWGRRGRRRILTEFSLERLLDDTEAVLWPKD